MLVKRLKSILPYLLLVFTYTILIITYITSRTIGVPIIGVEFYIGKYDILTKVLQGIIIASSGYLIYHIIIFNNYRTQEEKILKRKT
jgi:hypothetical protein